MIRKLKVKNYKSLRDVEVELGKFNVLIGPNAGGKSNLLDSLAFLSEITQEEKRKALDLRGGYERVVFGGKEENIEISIDFLLKEKPFKYFINFFFPKGIKEEKLTMEDKALIERGSPKEGKILSDKEEYRTLSQNPILPFIYSHGFYESDSRIIEARKYLSLWRFYQFITSEMRKTLPAKKSFNLAKRGENLAQVLLSLHTERPKVFQKIEDTLSQGITEVEELLTPLTEERETFIALREKGFERAFDYYQVSDGTLKHLAYITGVTLPESSLVCFEEPENFIHPYLLKLLVEVLRKSEKQIILSTHSPYLVNFVEPEEVIVVEKEEGETSLRKEKEPEKLREVLKELGLGELWISGALGGIP